MVTAVAGVQNGSFIGWDLATAFVMPDGKQYSHFDVILKRRKNMATLCESTHYSSRSRDSSSTPCRSEGGGQKLPRPKSADYDSTGESTYSLLSPIYHDSFESDPEDQEQHFPHTENIHSEETVLSSSHRDKSQAEVKVEKLSTPEFVLSPWEEWLICKARQDRLRMQRKTMEELALKETMVQQELEQQRKKAVVEEKITEWLQTKAQQEKLERHFRKCKELEEKDGKERKEMEVQQKSEQKYREWLQKKKREEIAKKRKEKEDAARKDAEARERKMRSEEKFKEWLLSVKGKARPVPNTSGYSSEKLIDYYNSSYPAPSFCNPIPWKPVHNPPPEDVPGKNVPKKNSKPLCQALYQPAPSFTFKPKDNLIVGSLNRSWRYLK